MRSVRAVMALCDRARSGARCGAQRHNCPSAHTLCTTLFTRSDGCWGAGRTSFFQQMTASACSRR